MAQITWARKAQRDVADIAAFIGRESPERAGELVTRIVEAVRRLADFPLSGRVIPERRRPNYREIICSPYRIMYRVVEQRVEIINVVHGARLWRRGRKWRNGGSEQE